MILYIKNKLNKLCFIGVNSNTYRMKLYNKYKNNNNFKLLLLKIINHLVKY